ncbi:MAG: hypothetical protein FWH50_02685, partial [Coriobacteriia bacterium]|nr:hypothetical protein [Coriobacteriia bacterium]
ELLPYLGSTRSGHMSLRRRVEAFDWDASSQQVADATGWLAGRRHSLGDVAADDSDESDLFDQPGADRLSGADLPLDNAYIAGSEDNADSADPAARRRPPAAAPVVKETKPLLWLRLNEKAQSILARLLAALATVATVFIGLSGFGLMGLGGGGIATGQPWRPVGGSIELTMPYTPSVLSPAEFRSQLLITLTILLVVGAVALLAPTIGGAIGAISLAAGLLARGLVIIGILTLAAAIAWWLLLGRRGWAESTLLSLAAPLAGLFMPFALPLLAASFMRPVRAVCSALAAWLLLLFVGGLSTPLLADLFASRLLTAGFVLDRAVEQFPPHFWALLTSPLSWLSLLAWLAACLCMLLFSKPGRLLSLKMPGSTESRRRAARKRASDAEASGRPASRLRLSMGAVLATVLQAAVLLVVPLATGNTASATSAGGLSWRLGMSLLFVLVLIQTGMVSGRIAYDDDSNAIDKE